MAQFQHEIDMQNPECPICCSPVATSFPARLAPFIKNIANIEGFGDVKAHHCTACDHGFFTPSLTAEQLSKVYTDYQGPEYNRIRVLEEPLYANHIEALADLENGPFHIGRRQIIDAFLPSYKGLTGDVLDFGGADGYFSKYAFPKAKVAIIEEGFEREGGDLVGELQRADFFMATHVFEHLPDPYTIVSRLFRWLRPGTPIYIELPISYHGTIAQNFEQIRREYANTGELPWHPIVLMHEHVANFSMRSAETLLRRCGARPVRSIFHPGLSMIGVLAKNGPQMAWLQDE